jgi:Mn-dependent DtxR family transcriptional regulator
MTPYTTLEILRIVSDINAARDLPAKTTYILSQIKGAKALILKALRHAAEQGFLEEDVIPAQGYWITEAGGELMRAFPSTQNVDPELLANASEVGE